MSHQPVMTALYDTHEQAEEAVKKLQHQGYDMKQLSIVGRDHHSEENVVGYYNMGDRVLKWGSNGAFWGSMWGMLMGSAFLLIPAVGPLLVAGPLVGMLVGALEGAVCLAASVPWARRWPAWVFPKTACWNTKPKSRWANTCCWRTAPRPK